MFDWLENIGLLYVVSVFPEVEAYGVAELAVNLRILKLASLATLAGPIRGPAAATTSFGADRFTAMPQVRRRVPLADSRPRRSLKPVERSGTLRWTGRPVWLPWP